MKLDIVAASLLQETAKDCVLKVYIHGNCQSTALSRMLLEVFPDWTVSSREVHVFDLASDMEAYEASIRNADLIISQPINEKYRGEPKLSTKWIEENKRNDAKLIKILPLYFMGYNPFSGYLPPHNAFKMPYHDYNIVDLYLRGVPADRAFKILSHPNFYDRKFLENEVARSISESYDREKAHNPDIKLTSFIENNYQETLLFFTFNHPSRAMLTEALRQILEAVGYPGHYANAAGREYLDDVIISPYESTIDAIKVNGGVLRGHVRAYDKIHERSEYISRQFEYYDKTIGRVGLSEAFKAMTTAVDYMSRFNDAHRDDIFTSENSRPSDLRFRVDNGVRYDFCRSEYMHKVKGAEIVFDVEKPANIENPAQYIANCSPEVLESISPNAPIVKTENYEVSGQRIVKVPNADLYCYPRVEGMVTSQDGFFIRETVGSSRVLEGNDLIRTIDNEHFFNKTAPILQKFKKAFVGFAPASANYAHWMGEFLPRLMIANDVLKDTALLFPDLPNYRNFSPGAARNELFYRLAELVPPINGNYYHPVPAGRFKIDELFAFQFIANRWDLVFYENIIEKFRDIGREAARRYKNLYSTDLPKNIYISRQNATHRRIINNDEVERAFLNNGYTIITMDGLDFWQQAAIFNGAERIASLHGAACANILFSNKDSSFMELHPTPLPSFQFLNTCIAMKQKYYAVIGKPVNSLLDVNIDMRSLINAVEAMK